MSLKIKNGYDVNNGSLNDISNITYDNDWNGINYNWSYGVNGLIYNNSPDKIIVKQLGIAMNGVQTFQGYFSNILITIKINSVTENPEPNTYSEANWKYNVSQKKYILNQDPVITTFDMDTTMFNLQYKKSGHTIIRRVLSPSQQFSMDPYEVYSVNIRTRYEKGIITPTEGASYYNPQILGYSGVYIPSTSKYMNYWPGAHMFAYTELGYIIDTTPFDCIHGTYTKWSGCSNDPLVRTRSLIGNQPARNGGIPCDAKLLIEDCTSLLFKQTINIENPVNLQFKSGNYQLNNGVIFNDNHENILIEQLELFVTDNDSEILSHSPNSIGITLSYTYPKFQLNPGTPELQSSHVVNLNGNPIKLGLNVFTFNSPVEIQGNTHINVGFMSFDQNIYWASDNTQPWYKIGYKLITPSDPIDCIEGNALTPYTDPEVNNDTCNIVRSQHRVGDIQPIRGGVECSDVMFIDDNVSDLKVMNQSLWYNKIIQPANITNNTGTVDSIFDTLDHPIVIKEITVVVDAFRWFYKYDVSRPTGWKNWLIRSPTDIKTPMQEVRFQFRVYDAYSINVDNVGNTKLTTDNRPEIFSTGWLPATKIGFDMKPIRAPNTNNNAINPLGKCYVTIKLPEDKYITINNTNHPNKKFGIRVDINKSEYINFYGDKYPNDHRYINYMKVLYNDLPRIPQDCIPGTTFSAWGNCETDPLDNCNIRHSRYRLGDVDALYGGKQCDPYEYKSCEPTHNIESIFSKNIMAYRTRSPQLGSFISFPAGITEMNLMEITFLAVDTTNSTTFNYSSTIKIGVAEKDYYGLVNYARYTVPDIYESPIMSPTAIVHMGGGIYELTYTLDNIRLLKSQFNNYISLVIKPVTQSSIEILTHSNGLDSPWSRIKVSSSQLNVSEDCKVNDIWSEWGECTNNIDGTWEESRSKYQCPKFGGAGCDTVNISMCDTFGGEYCTYEGCETDPVTGDPINCTAIPKLGDERTIEEIKQTHLLEHRSCTETYVEPDYGIDGSPGPWSEWESCIENENNDMVHRRTRNIPCPRYGGGPSTEPSEEWKPCNLGMGTAAKIITGAIATIAVVVAVIAAIISGPMVAAIGLVVTSGLGVGITLGSIDPNYLSKVKNSVTGSSDP